MTSPSDGVSDAGQARDGLPTPQLQLAIATLATGIVMSVLDSSIANMALPTIARDFGASPQASIWVVNGYQMAVAIALLPLAGLGDVIGYRRVYLGGLALFTVASLLCAVAPTLPLLTAARAAQGLGAAGIMSVNMALVRAIYPARLFGRGLAVNTTLVAISSGIGPTVAGAILAIAPWPYLFLMNIPIGIIAVAIGLRALPVTPRASHRYSLAAALGAALMLGGLLLAVEGVGHQGHPLLTLAALSLAVVAALWLVRHEHGAPAPIFPVDLLRIPMLSLSAATSICAFAAQALALVSLPFLLQEEFGLTPLESGLLLTPWPVGLALVSPLSGWLSDRYPAGVLGAVGMAMLSVGFLGLVSLPTGTADVPRILASLLLAGAGYGLWQTPNNRALLTAAPRTRDGGASGLLGTARLVGQTTGTSLVALAFVLAPTSGSRAAFLIGIAAAVCAATISSVRLVNRTGPARRGP